MYDGELARENFIKCQCFTSGDKQGDFACSEHKLTKTTEAIQYVYGPASNWLPISPTELATGNRELGPRGG